MSGLGPISGRADINQVLSEMRNLKAQMQRPEAIRPEMSPTEIRGSQPAAEIKPTPSFSEMLTKAVDNVNDTQKQSSALQKTYEMGDPNVSISQVMIQSQKSSVSFQALLQVRNKVVKAYEDIMKMPV